MGASTSTLPPASAPPPERPAPTPSRLPPPTVTAEDRVVIDLKITRDKLTKAIQKKEAEVERLREAATDLVRSGDRTSATYVLRTKRMHETSLQTLRDLKISILTSLNDIDVGKSTVAAAVTMKAGNEALKALTKLVPLDEIQQLMEESRAHSDHLAEVREMIGARFDESAGVEDEETLRAELEALTQRDAAETLPSVPDHPVKIKAIPVQMEEEEEPESSGRVALLA